MPLSLWQRIQLRIHWQRRLLSLQIFSPRFPVSSDSPPTLARLSIAFIPTQAGTALIHSMLSLCTTRAAAHIYGDQGGGSVHGSIESTPSLPLSEGGPEPVIGDSVTQHTLLWCTSDYICICVFLYLCSFVFVCICIFVFVSTHALMMHLWWAQHCNLY